MTSQNHTVMSLCGVAEAGYLKHSTSGLPQDVALVDLGDLVAVGHWLQTDGGQSFQQMAENFEWLSAQAMNHNQLLQSVFGHCTVLPFKLGTFFASELAAKQELKSKHNYLKEQLNNLKGKQEWSLKVYQYDQVDESFINQLPALQTQLKELEGMTAGKSFFLKKKLEKQKKEIVQNARIEQLQNIANQVVELGAEMNVGKLIGKQLTGRKDDMIFNLSVLIDQELTTQFQTLLQQYTTDFTSLGLEAILSGPYPPYHFLAPEHEPTN